MITPHARDHLWITLELGASWSGWTFKGQIRQFQDNTSTLIETFTADVTNIATGTIIMKLTAAEVQAITPGVAYWFDIRAEETAAPTSRQITFVKDEILFDPNVTT